MSAVDTALVDVKEVFSVISAAAKFDWSGAVKAFEAGDLVQDYATVEEVARLLSPFFPVAGTIAADMADLQPLVPIFAAIAKNAKPIQPGDPNYNAPAGNSDAYNSGSDDV